MGFKEDLRKFALEQGIDMVGFASVDPFIKESEILKDRKSRGLSSPFEEEDVDLRCYPERLMPGAKTIISCALGYLVEDYRPQETLSKELDGYHGKISRYARVRDYHEVMEEKLKAIVNYMSSKKSCRCEIFVDTGSLMDKAVAVRAGLGWLGANTCLFTEGLGSWVFLGEILTDVYIEPDEPMESKCDECGRCVRACPTGALMAPFQINPHRCLSYITQKKGEIPEEFLDPLGNRLFGCDTCQEACPKNCGVKAPDHPEFAPKISLRHDLWQVVNMTKKDFEKTFRVTAAGWRGRNVLRRNALCVLGNIGQEDCLGPLERLLEDPSKMVRNQARRARDKILYRAYRNR